jgi:hypothetical protein
VQLLTHQPLLTDRGQRTTPSTEVLLSASDTIKGTERPRTGRADLDIRAQSKATRDRRSMSRTSQLILAYCGWGMFACFLPGFVILGRYFPAAIKANQSAGQTAAFYAHHTTQIRIGLLFCLVLLGLMGTWGVSMATQFRRKEGLYPALTYAQLTAMAAGTAQCVVNVGLWAVAAYRPGQIDPQITQAFNDAGWLLLMGTWITFTIWAIALGLAVLLDKSANPVYPRWAGYLSVWAGLLYAPGGLLWFFKSGAGSWRGAIALYTPWTAFGIWIITFTLLTIRNIKNGAVHEQVLPGDPEPHSGLGDPVAAHA